LGGPFAGDEVSIGGGEAALTSETEGEGTTGSTVGVVG